MPIVYGVLQLRLPAGMQRRKNDTKMLAAWASNTEILHCTSSKISTVYFRKFASD